MLHITKQVMGIEPTYPAWKAGVLAFILYLHIKFTYDFYELYNLYLSKNYIKLYNSYLNKYTM